jgi:hypothetical protein
MPWSESDQPTWEPAAAPPPAVSPEGRPVITVRPKTFRAWSESDQPAWEPPPPAREISGGEAFVRGATDAATFGLQPTLSGLQAAATAPGATPEETAMLPVPGVASEAPGMESMGVGLERVRRGDEEARRAYEQARAAEAEAHRAAFEQHPYLTTGGEIGGSLLTPGFGAGTAAATWPARLALGARAGAIGGGLYGIGESIGQGGTAEEAVRGGAAGAVMGGVLGGPLHSVFGPRLPNAATQRAAQTAEELGAPLPRAVTGGPVAESVAAITRSFPLVGPRIGAALHRTEEAAGERVRDIAGGLVAPGRAGADEVVRSGLQGAIDSNKADIDAAYTALRSKLHPATPVDLTQTETALQNVINRRIAKRELNPKAGLEQVINAVDHPQRISFEGARGLRSDVRDAGDIAPHPGLNGADYNRLAEAITGDMRVTAARNRALPEFDKADAQFRVLAEQNRQINKQLKAAGERAIGAMIGAARPQSGYARELERLKQIMPADKFQAIGGQILHEIGIDPKTGTFSLAKFTTDWNRQLSREAKQALFSPEHLKNLEDIFHLGKTIKTSLATTQQNFPHTATPLIFVELAQHIADAISEGRYLKAASGVALAPAGLILTHWLASPAKAQAMSVWGKALQGMMAAPTVAARRAVFNTATRKLAQQLGVPAERIIDAAMRTIAPDNAANTVTLTPVQGNPHAAAP